MSILTLTTINSDTLAIKGKVKWTYNEVEQIGTSISNINNSGVGKTDYTSDYSFESIVKFPVIGTYTFTYQCASKGVGSIYMSNINEVLNPQSSNFLKGISNNNSKAVITITTTVANTLMKMYLKTDTYDNVFSSSTAPTGSDWTINKYCYCLCENNTGCESIVSYSGETNSLLNSSTCLTINSNTLVSKNNAKWTGTNTDGTKTIWYDVIDNPQVNKGKTYTNLICEALLKFPTGGVYTFSINSSNGATLFMSSINEILTNTANFQLVTTSGPNAVNFTITTKSGNEIKKLLIKTTTAGSMTILSLTSPPTYYSNGPDLGPPTLKNIISNINEITYCLCDNNTLTNCTYLMPDNLVVIKGMVKQAWYKENSKQYTDFKAFPMPKPSTSTLISQIYTSSLNILDTDVSSFSSSTGTAACTTTCTGYITFPKTEVYYWDVTCDDHCMILFGSPTMVIDTNNPPTSSSIYYSTPMSGDKIMSPMQVEAGKMYRFMIIYHNSGGPGYANVKIREGSVTASPMSIPLSWLSSDYTLDYTDAYQKTVLNKCGNTDYIWTGNNGCTDVFNDNISNILQAKNKNGKKYADLIIAQCSNSNTGTKSDSCSSVFKFSSKDPSIVNAYCNDNDRYILDSDCRNYAIQNPSINYWGSKQLDYCTASYNNLISTPCTSYYTSKANKSTVYSKFCTDTNGTKMLSNKTTANDCLVNDTKNLDANIALIKSTCNHNNTTLFGGFCNDMAPDTRFNDSITAARLNSCTDAAIDADLVTKTSCVPYLSDPSRLPKVDTRIVSYCENGTNRFSNALCSTFYGTDGTPKLTNSDAVIQKSIDFKLYNECTKNNKFAIDPTCSSVALNDLNNYASQIVSYCNLPDNIGKTFCKTAYTTLIGATKNTCSVPPSTASAFMNKEVFTVVKSLKETLISMNDYNLTTSCHSEVKNDDRDMKSIFMFIIAFVVISLLISLVINKIKKSKQTQSNITKSNTEHPEMHFDE